MASALPVMATRVGGNVEIVEDGRWGHLFDSGNLAHSCIGSSNTPATRPREPRTQPPRAGRRSSASVSIRWSSITGPCTRDPAARSPLPGLTETSQHRVRHLTESSRSMAARPRRCVARMGRVTVHRGPDDRGSCRRPLRHRHAPAVDHRRRRRPPAAVQRGRHAVARVQRRDLQLSRAARGAAAPGHRFRTRLGLRDDPASVRAARRRFRAAPERHVRVRAVGRAAPAPARRARPARRQAAVYLCSDAPAPAFASEAKALLALPGVSAALDPAALQSYLALGYVPAPQSMFRGIRKLPPATVLVVENGRVTRAPLLALPARRRSARSTRTSGSSAMRERARANRCACRW